jgi:hypothetical protein
MEITPQTGLESACGGFNSLPGRFVTSASSFPSEQSETAC